MLYEFDVDRVASALDGVPRAAYSVPHVYPSAAPAYSHAPAVERARYQREKMRLYVHVPFCSYKCTYCYFSVKVGAQRDEMERYVGALEKELQWLEPGSRMSQLYVGGGTPTALPPELFDRTLGSVFERLPDSRTAVHTVETSPETVSEAHLEILAAHGVRRVSMGIQSLSDTTLDKIARRQTAEQSLRACAMLASSGLISNIDLIYGLPGQTMASFRHDFETVAKLGIVGVTFYSLRVNERTPIRKVLKAEERFDLTRLIQWRAFIKQVAAELGFSQTRWHTFKRMDTHAAQHRRLQTFDRSMLGHQLGIGVSARSHLGHTVYRNHPDLASYLARMDARQSPTEYQFPLDGEDLRTQFIARTIGDGSTLDKNLYQETFETTVNADYGPLLERLERGGLLVDRGTELALTELGEYAYDLVTLAFYPERARRWLVERPQADFVRIKRSAGAADGVS